MPDCEMAEPCRFRDLAGGLDLKAARRTCWLALRIEPWRVDVLNNGVCDHTGWNAVSLQQPTDTKPFGTPLLKMYFPEISVSLSPAPPRTCDF